MSANVNDITLRFAISDVNPQKPAIDFPMSIGEIQRGIARLDDGRRKQALQHWLEHDLLARFAGRILAVGLGAALEWGLVGAARERSGRPAPVTDSLIAATAIAHNLVLVTRNQKDFSGYPVKVLNPWSAAAG